MLRAAPWTRALWLTARLSPGSFVACVLSASVLCAAAASGPLFLASTASAALHSEAAQTCPEQSQTAISNDPGPAAYPTPVQAPRRLASSDARVRAASRRAGLPDPYRVSTTVVPGPSPDGAYLYARAGSTSHVTMVSGRPGRLVVPATYAAAAHVAVGSPVRVGARTLPVDGIYRDLAPSAFLPLFELPRYWCQWSASIVPTPFGRPPPMFLVSDQVLVAAGGTVTSTWYDPTPAGTRTDAGARAAVSSARRAVADLDTGFHLDTSLPQLLVKTARVRTGLRGPVVPIVVAAVMIAAVLVMAGAAFWGVRRRREIRLLAARGVGPGPLGLKASLELLPALALGGLIGWLAAIRIVQTTGPSSLLEPGAPRAALTASAVAAAGGLLLVGIVAARVATTDRRPRRRWLRLVPWELALGGASVACYLAIRRDGAVRVDHATVQINALVIAYPMIAISAALVLIARVSGAGLPRLRRFTPRSTGRYWAVRRIGRTPAVAVGVLVGVALPVALFVYSVALSGSTQRNVDAKYRANVGVPRAVGLLTHGRDPRPGHLGTVVARVKSDATTATGAEVTVLGVDPGSFARFAYGGAELRPAMRALARPGGAHAVLVNADAGFPARDLRLGSASLRVDVVARRGTFPGLRNPYRPMIVVDRRYLPAASPTVDRSDELWTTSRGLDPALARLSAQGVDANYLISPTDFLNSSGLRPVTWVFDYLRAIALLTAAVGLAGLAYAYAARTRTRARTYHLARRMGLTRSAHRRSLAVELTAVVGASWLAGALLALGAIGSVYRLTDSYPAFPPPPAFPSVSTPLTLTAGAAALVVVVATVVLQRLSERARPAELLRA